MVGRWGARFQGRAFPVSIGRGGLSDRKREGDGATPVGVWLLLRGYWRGDRVVRPKSNLDISTIGPMDRWSDDPLDPHYNRHVRACSWPYSHECLRRGDKLYDIVIVTNHNDVARPHEGSAIFVHCWRSARHPTAGCIAFRPDHLRWILARWTSASRLIIHSR
ncbi:MAG: L,D-transpeptidase family protein [Pseudomonadota bacterium]